MTFVQLKGMLADTVQRAELLPTLGNFINAALRDIQSAYSWSRMRTSAAVTILKDESLVALPTNFKELVGTVNSVYQQTSTGILKPVDVVSEAAERRRLWAAGGEDLEELRVFLLYGAENVSLGVVKPVEAAVNFIVHYYGFFDDLVEDSDTNWFLEGERWFMVLARAKQLCFEYVNDDIALRVGSAAKGRIGGAAEADAAAEASGRADVSGDVFRRRLMEAVKRDARVAGTSEGEVVLSGGLPQDVIKA